MVCISSSIQKFVFSRMSNKRNHVVPNFLTLACLIQHNAFEFHSNYCVYHSFCSLNTISLYSVYPFILWRISVLFPSFSYHVKLLLMFMYCWVTGLSVYITSQETDKWFFRVGYHLAFSPPIHEGSRWQHLMLSRFSVLAVLSLCVVVCDHGFNLHLPNG